VESVPADGKEYQNTEEAFSCRGWTKDVLYALEDSGLVRLATSVEDIDIDAKDAAKTRMKWLKDRFRDESSRSASSILLSFWV